MILQSYCLYRDSSRDQYKKDVVEAAAADHLVAAAVGVAVAVDFVEEGVEVLGAQEVVVAVSGEEDVEVVASGEDGDLKNVIAITVRWGFNSLCK